MTHETLGRSDVHLWLCFHDQASDPDVLASCEKLLDATERARMARFKFDVHRRQFLLSHALVRTALSRYADREPHEWRFEIGSHGRPAIGVPDGLPALDFNLSHTDGLTACAVSAGVGVGVDVEKMRRLDDLPSLARRSFSSVEMDDLLALPEVDHHRRFFELWSLKESYIKARGIGVSLGLDRFSFRLSAGAPLSLDLDPSLGDVAERWQVLLLRPTSGHMAALMLEGDAAPQLRTRASIPLHSERDVNLTLVASRQQVYPDDLRATLDDELTRGRTLD